MLMNNAVLNLNKTCRSPFRILNWGFWAARWFSFPSSPDYRLLVGIVVGGLKEDVAVVERTNCDQCWVIQR